MNPTTIRSPKKLGVSHCLHKRAIRMPSQVKSWPIGHSRGLFGADYLFICSPRPTFITASRRRGSTPGAGRTGLSLARAAPLVISFAWGPTPTRAAGADSPGQPNAAAALGAPARHPNAVAALGAPARHPNAVAALGTPAPRAGRGRHSLLAGPHLLHGAGAPPPARLAQGCRSLALRRSQTRYPR